MLTYAEPAAVHVLVDGTLSASAPVYVVTLACDGCTRKLELSYHRPITPAEIAALSNGWYVVRQKGGDQEPLHFDTAGCMAVWAAREANHSTKERLRALEQHIKEMESTWAAALASVDADDDEVGEDTTQEERG